MKKFLLPIVTITLLVGGLIISTKMNAVTAAETSRIQIDITPIETNLSLAPGETYDGEFGIINRGDSTFNFHVTANEFYVKDLTYETTYDSGIAFSQIAYWVTFDQENFYGIGPNEKQQVTYHIKVPDDAPGGGQYAVLFAVVSDERINESVGIKTDSRVGMKIYAKISGETRSSGKIKSINQPWFYSTSIVNSVAQVENTGNVDFNSHHEYVAESLLGGELFRNSALFRIMPNTTREINMKWADAPSFGIFRVRNKITFLGETKYDQEKIVIIAPIWLIVLAIVALVLLLGLIFFIILFIIKKIRHKKSHKKLKNTPLD